MEKYHLLLSLVLIFATPYVSQKQGTTPHNVQNI